LRQPKNLSAYLEGNELKNTLSLLLLLTGISSLSAASEPTDIIIVTATRTEIALQDASVPVEIISRDEIELSMANDLGELLRFEAGIDIGRNGGPGQATSIFLRGTESNHTLVLVDGVRINPGTIGGAAIQNIVPEMIERVEIVKGARSALYGTDAIGGVIHVITRRSQKSFATASIGGGSFNTRSQKVSVGTKQGESEFGVSVNHNKTNGFPIQTMSDVTRGHHNKTINLYGTMNLGGSLFSLSHWSANGVTEYLDFFLSPLDHEFENRSTSLEIGSSFGKQIESRIAISQMVDDIKQNQSTDFVESTRLSLDWQLSWSGDQHKVTGGLYVVDEEASAISFGSGFHEKTSTHAVFLQDQWSVGRHRAFFATRVTEHETFGNATTWNAEYALKLSEKWVLRTGFARAFRAPDATDRFGWGGNPNLNPELSNETQLSISYNGDSRHSLSLQLYKNDISDLIEFNMATFELANIAKAKIRGAELNWNYESSDFSVRGSIVKQAADNPLDNVRLLRRPEDSITLSIIKNIGQHRLGLSLVANGDRKDFGQVNLPGYALVNLTGQLAITDKWRLNGRIENLLDREYETAFGYRMQELSGFAELNYTWQ
tara:strand:+ start:2319 stop:4130 length:1812 start_codon:yes stop_codon:yes gene_type:complete